MAKKRRNMFDGPLDISAKKSRRIGKAIRSENRDFVKRYPEGPGAGRKAIGSGKRKNAAGKLRFV